MEHPKRQSQILLLVSNHNVPNFLILSTQLTNWLETNLAFFDIAKSQFHYQMTGVTDEADFQLKIKSELLFSQYFG
ncbi:hypothetical protein LA20533_00015 [Amylolactobacillus amylophilus DSM 20533 = JCM 1125]|uniref:Uncharacterized protein n=1 Tax=Amylolactobacillus amylophilus DSM 20533 = JCM 1125 TaxID=1423721 RepID=A0A1L6XA04_9LACO|nr:hypothetical protein LA20533_00015 [Amylolactobacillus amylophilus DSM 20533 = JCM 1125]